MSEREGEKSGRERIKSKKTLKEILEVATSFEQAARDFYRDLATQGQQEPALAGGGSGGRGATPLRSVHATGRSARTWNSR